MKTNLKFALSIRRARATDGLSCRELVLAALRDSSDAFGTTFEEARARSENWWLTRVRELADAEDQAMFFACSNSELWGSVTVALGKPAAHIGGMWVRPDCRRNGIGKSLLTEAIRWAEGKGASSIDLWVTEGNQPAVSLYERVGFSVTGEQDALRPGSLLRRNRMVRQKAQT